MLEFRLIKSQRLISDSIFCRAFEDEKKAKMGVTECARHELLNAYPVLYEKEGEFVAQMKYTVLLMPNGPLRYRIF